MSLLSRARRAVAALKRRRAGAPYRIVEKWKPRSAGEKRARGALGVRLVLERDLDADELRALVRELAIDHDPVVIQVYRTDAAYHAARAGQMAAPSCRSGYVLSFTARASSGELVWMQEIGALAALFGRKEELNTGAMQ